MTDTNSPRPFSSMTTGEADAWRQAYRAGRRDGLDAAATMLGSIALGEPDRIGRALFRASAEIRAQAMEPPA